jgi:hypothetical protein
MLYSNKDELQAIASIVQRYLRLPVATDAIPGALMEAVLAHVRGGKVLPTYDYVDVIKESAKVGWSIKSTKSTTPVTWKRAKIADKERLIAKSRETARGRQRLGDEILGFCNEHACASMEKYGLVAIGYARLLIEPSGKLLYFERELCSRKRPYIFDPGDFEWRWSEPKNTKSKEQLPALHGYHRASGKKWWAWHGLGENQLHFSGESEWWPARNDDHAIAFSMPSESDKLTFPDLLALLDGA